MKKKFFILGFFGLAFAFILSFSCTKENGLITTSTSADNSMTEPSSFEDLNEMEFNNYDPCKSSKFKDLADPIFIIGYVDGYQKMEELISENDTNFITSLTTSELVNLMYQKKYNTSANYNFSNLDSINNLSSNPNLKNYFKIITEVNDLIVKSDSFYQFILTFKQYTNQIDLNLVNENEKMLISTFLFSLEMLLFEKTCLPSSTIELRWRHPIGGANMKGAFHHVKIEHIKCVVSIFGGAVLGFFGGGGPVTGAAGAAVGWASGC